MAGTSAVRNAIEFEGAEFRLRVGQDVFHGRELQQIPRIARTEADALSAVHDRAAEPKATAAMPSE